jgi:hypothetical protein
MRDTAGEPGRGRETVLPAEQRNIQTGGQVLRALGGIVDDPVTRRLLQEATLVEAWREGDNAANQPPGGGVP